MGSTRRRTDSRRRVPQQVVVLGAGFAGVRAALGLAAQPGLRVTLVDRSDRPPIKTQLHELRDEAPRFAARCAVDGTGVHFERGEVESIDRAARRVQVDGRSLSYDWLVFALGSRTSDLGVAGVSQHALRFDRAKDTERFAALVDRLGRDGGRLVVVGAGPTGVEAAGEAGARLKRGQVVLLESAQRILPHFPTLPRLYAEGTLRWLGVTLRTGSEVRSVERSRVALADGSPIACEAVVWCAGIEPSPLLAKSGLSEPARPAAVDRFLVSRVDPRVYVVGDCAATPDATSGRPSAQIAVQQGDHVARDLVQRLRRKRREPFEGSLLGELLSLGPWETTGKIHLGALELPIFLIGPLAGAAKRAGLLRHQVAVAWSSRALRFSRLLDRSARSDA